VYQLVRVLLMLQQAVVSGTVRLVLSMNLISVQQ
jgi:hypothetical protein